MNRLPESFLAVPLPENECTRLEMLQQYQILDTEPETIFDELTELAAQICQTPVALINFVTGDRQWLKAKTGTDTIEAPLDVGFCPIVVHSGDRLIIPDTQADERFANNPVVQASPHVRFYAGIPLVTSSGYVLGTLCVLDFVPRQLNPIQLQSLQTLSRQVMTQLEAQLSARRIRQMDAALIQVSQGVCAAVGEAFFYSLVKHLSDALGVEYAYVCQINQNDPDKATTIAFQVGGQVADNVEYSLEQTPCGEVIRKRQLCCYPRNVQAYFPDAYLLGEMEIESYAAIPLIDSSGIPLGVLGVMGCQPFTNVQLIESLLSIFATRAVAELERQQAEAERAQLLQSEQTARQEAETANRVKDEFLAVLSHELRTPLNPILGWSKLLQSGKLDATKTAFALETIQRNVNLQTQLIDDLLDVSRILRGKLLLNMHPVNLASITAAGIETVRLAAEAKSIQIQTYFDPDLGKVLGDAGRLQQVVWNLLSNAVKFTPTGGRVEIRLEQIDSNAQISVSDTGNGIEPEFIPYMFETFRQADSTITRKFGGLGLGLAIARHLVELHGGTINAHSAGSGLGATFLVQLPLINSLPYDTTTTLTSTTA